MRGISFSVLGVPVRIDPSFWVFAAILAYPFLLQGRWDLLAIWIVVVLLSLLAHEMGHAIAFRRFDHRPEITIYAMGGLTSSTTPGGLPPGRDVVISLAGPLTGIAIGALIVPFAPSVWPPLPVVIPSDAGLAAFHIAFFTNALWGVLNLIPMLPLDGGRTMAAILRRFRPRDGHRWALFISVGIGAAAAVAAALFQQFFALLIVGFLTASNVGQLRQARGNDPASRLRRELTAGIEAARRGDIARAAHVGRWARQDGEPLPPVVMAALALEEARPRDALEMVRQARARAPQDPGTAADLAAVLVATGRLDEAAHLLDASALPNDTARLLHAAYEQANRPFEAARAAARVAGP